MSDISKDILDLLESSGKPLSLSEIASDLCYSKSTLIRTLKRMVDEKQIQSYTAKTSKGNYYVDINYYAKTDVSNDCSTKDIGKLIDELNQKYVNLDSDLQSKSEILDKRIEEVENNTKNIYLNIISIIAVFIAIFTLITTNIQILGKYISVKDTLCDVAMKMAVINIPLVIVIFFVLLMIRCLILKPLKAAPKKKEPEE